MNRLIVIGWIGAKRVYFNLPMAEAFKRYQRDEGGLEEVIRDGGVSIVEFIDEFTAYDVWEVS